MLQLSTCPKLTSAERFIVMWANRVIPIGQHRPSLQADRCLFLRAYFPAYRVFVFIQTGATMEPRVRARCPNMLQHQLIAHQGFSRPVGTDQAEHAMVDWIPLRR